MQIDLCVLCGKKETAAYAMGSSSFQLEIADSYKLIFASYAVKRKTAAYAMGSPSFQLEVVVSYKSHLAF